MVVRLTLRILVAYYGALLCFVLPWASEAVKWSGKIVFEDNFDKANLDLSKWEYQTGCDEQFGPGNLECYQGGTKNIQVRNGTLVIMAKVEKKENKNYTSGRIRQKQKFLYGAYVVRARLPNGKHLWPAIWMLEEDPECRYEEIDIMEYRGQRPQEVEMTVWFGRNWDARISQKGDRLIQLPKDLSVDFHEYAVLWTPKKIEWWIDDTMHESLDIKEDGWTTDPNKKPCGPNQRPFSEASRFILNMAVGGEGFFPHKQYGNLTIREARRWPKPTFEIDWVRIYQDS